MKISSSSVMRATDSDGGVPVRILARSLFERIFPSSQRRGGCAVIEKARSRLDPRRRDGQTGKILVWRRTDHPVRSAQRRLRDIYLMSRPPLLCEEGNVARFQTDSLPERLTLFFSFLSSAQSSRHPWPVLGFPWLCRLLLPSQPVHCRFSA